MTNLHAETARLLALDDAIKNDRSNEMDKETQDFENWFDILQMQLSDYGIRFSDKESTRRDYDEGRSVFDVIDEIRLEYGE